MRRALPLIATMTAVDMRWFIEGKPLENAMK
jgi:hypothetical protein